MKAKVARIAEDDSHTSESYPLYVRWGLRPPKQSSMIWWCFSHGILPGCDASAFGLDATTQRLRLRSTFRTKSLSSSLSSTGPGVFVAGKAKGPRDIPDLGRRRPVPQPWMPPISLEQWDEFGVKGGSSERPRQSVAQGGGLRVPLRRLYLTTRGCQEGRRRVGEVSRRRRFP